MDTRQRHFKKNIESLPSAMSGALGKVFFKKKIFAECLTASTRQRRTWPNTITRGSLCRVPSFCREPSTRQRRPLPSALFYRVQFFAECDTRQRRSLPSVWFLTLGKGFVSRSDWRQYAAICDRLLPPLWWTRKEVSVGYPGSTLARPEYHGAGYADYNCKDQDEDIYGYWYLPAYLGNEPA